MMVSDPSDSDSTILASEPPQRRLKTNNPQDSSGDHRIVIQVKGPDKEAVAAPRNTSPRQARRRGNPGNAEFTPPAAAQNLQRTQTGTVPGVVATGSIVPEHVGYQVMQSLC